MIYPQWSVEEDTEGSAQTIQLQKMSAFICKPDQKTSYFGRSLNKIHILVYIIRHLGILRGVFQNNIVKLHVV